MGSVTGGTGGGAGGGGEAGCVAIAADVATSAMATAMPWPASVRSGGWACASLPLFQGRDEDRHSHAVLGAIGGGLDSEACWWQVEHAELWALLLRLGFAVV